MTFENLLHRSLNQVYKRKLDFPFRFRLDWPQKVIRRFNCSEKMG